MSARNRCKLTIATLVFTMHSFNMWQFVIVYLGFNYAVGQITNWYYCTEQLQLTSDQTNSGELQYTDLTTSGEQQNMDLTMLGKQQNTDLTISEKQQNMDQTTSGEQQQYTDQTTSGEQWNTNLTTTSGEQQNTDQTTSGEQHNSDLTSLGEQRCTKNPQNKVKYLGNNFLKAQYQAILCKHCWNIFK